MKSTLPLRLKSLFRLTAENSNYATVGEVLLWAVIFWVMDGDIVMVYNVVTSLSTLEGEAVILLSSGVTGVIAGIPLMYLLRRFRRN